MSFTLLIIFLALTVIALLAEKRRLPSPLMTLELKGDVRRESWWLQQYGQAVCTPVAGLLIWELDPVDSGNKAVTLIAAVGVTSLTCMVLKRLFGRVRPGREGAGKFLGPSWRLRGGSHRESFPSSHTACAVALTTSLTVLYPHGWTTFWLLAFVCAALRYVLDAHWPSDVFAGGAVGYAVAHLAFVLVPPMFRYFYEPLAPYIHRYLHL
jgi:membrane-associated phospholipid phosphatase